MTHGVDHGLRDSGATAAETSDSSIAGLIDVMTKHTPMARVAPKNSPWDYGRTKNAAQQSRLQCVASTGSILVVAALIGMLPRKNIHY